VEAEATAAAPTTTSRSRRRVGRAILALAAGLLLVAGGLAAWAWSLATASECADLPREDLTLYEMGQLRRTLDRYKSDPSSPMSLTPRQASFLVREQFELEAWLTVAGDQVLLEARQPTDRGCWNVAFRGRINVRDGVAHVLPTDLSIGRLGLGWIASLRSWEVRPNDLADARAADLLSHLTAASVSGGWFYVEVDDPRWIR
jgi:hypothetical protein